MTIWCMGFACWITKATNTHSEYEILITFPMQQWLLENACIIGYTDIPFSYLRLSCITALDKS